MDWERRYKEGFYPSSLEAHWLLKEFCEHIPFPPVLEIAMGVGRDTLFLAEKGYETVGIDISMEALKNAKVRLNSRKLENVLLIKADALRLPFKDESFGCVVIFYFLLREAIEEIKMMLKKGGLVIYETFLKRQNMVDRWRNPQYLLDDGELLFLFRDFACIFYEEGLFKIEGKLKAIARFVGKKI